MIDTEISLYKESDFIFIKKDDAYIKLAKKKQVERYIENKIKKVNAMSEEEWQLYLIQHPTTILRKYRNKK